MAMDLQQQLEQFASLSQQGRYHEAADIAIGICLLISQHQGKKHPNFAASLHNLAVTYMALGKYADAEPVLLQAIDIRSEVLDENHPSLASSLGELATLQLKTGRLAEAERNFKRAIEIYSRLGSDNNPELARCLHALATLCIQMGDQDGYDKAAEVLLLKALEIWEKAVGEDHPNYAKTVWDLSQLYLRAGNWPAAEPLCLWLLESNRKLLRNDPSEYAAQLKELAILYRHAGDYGAASSYMSQSVEIRKQLGENNSDYAAELSDLAELYFQIGNYAAAEPLMHQLVKICRAVFGESHPALAENLNNLATLYYLKGNYAAAEPRFRQAVEIWEKSPGENHQGYASGLMNLAGLYWQSGRYSLVEPLYRRAIEIQQRILGDEDPGFATTLGGLGNYYREMSNFEAAEPLLRRALAICLKVLGENHSKSLDCLNNLAILCHYQHKLDEAESLFRQVLEAPRTEQQKRDASYITAVNGLGVLYASMGRFGAAEPLYRQALEKKRETVGENNPSFAIALRNLALVCAATGREAEALILMEQAVAIDDRMIGEVFSIGTESQRMAYLISLSSKSDLYLSLVSQRLPSSAAAVRAALDFVLRRKAIALEVMAVQRDVILGGKYPHLQGKLGQLATLRMQLAQMELAGPQACGPDDHRLLLAMLKTERDGLQQELAQQVPEMNLELKLKAADRQAVALALPNDSALIEFVRFSVGTYDFDAVAARDEAVWKPPHYLAFILPAAAPDNVQMVDLGLAEPIDQMIATFRATITGEGESRAYQDQDATLSDGFSDLSDGAALRTTVFDPLLTAIGGRTRLLLAPDGDLTRLPFEVLPSANGRRLIDEYRISYLGAGRDVLRFGATSIVQATAPLVVADPDFDLSEGSGASLLQPANVAQTPSPSRLSRDADRNAMHFGRLPGTQVEGQRIAQMLGVEPRLAAAALESQLKACRSPRILHLATHGFFLADQKHDPNNEQDNLMALGEQSTGGMGRFSGRGLENPLLRSGLALAGVNTWLQQGTVPTEAEDGILTAEDVSGLDLLATELVVLSACETGLGEVHTGEGVFGLRRAFVLAGARTLVMSLWKVSDLSTAILMERFYHNLLRRKLGRDESLRQAQFYTRDVSVGEIRDGWLRSEVIERLAAGDEKAKNYFQRLARKPDEHRPFSAVEYWGAFICQGDPAALA